MSVIHKCPSQVLCAVKQLCKLGNLNVSGTGGRGSQRLCQKSENVTCVENAFQYSRVEKIELRHFDTFQINLCSKQMLLRERGFP